MSHFYGGRAAPRRQVRCSPAWREEGLTLVELLVAIGVIAILVLLSLTVSSSLALQAKEGKSMQQLRQIGVALHAFISEHNGQIMPRAYAATGIPKGESRYWTATLYNYHYLRDKRAFYDPRFPPYGPDEAASSQRIEGGTPATYGMRDWVKPGEAILTSTTRVAKPVTVVREPANFFIVADSYWVAWETQGYGISPGETSENRVRLSRGGKAGALFLDGHVEKKPGEYFTQLGETQGEYSAGLPFSTWQAPD